MKQYITIEQLNELNLKQSNKLNSWYIKINSYENSDEFPPLLSIGQMIEFLFDNDFGPIITSNDTAFYWIVEPEKHLECWKKYSYENSELCDALWEAIKDILK